MPEIAVNPPRPRMPPLNALRAFEAAARHESFAKAADELLVTPAAVSHSVKALEEWLGSPLFARHAQGLHLTEAGRSAAPAFTMAFDALGSAVQQLRANATHATLNIAALPSVAQLWLAPKMPGLRAAFPNARFAIHAIEAPPNFRRDPYDLAIFFVREPPPGMRSVTLFEDRIFPVCAPAIAPSLRSPADLARYPLLQDTTWAEDWTLWLAAAGASDVAIHEGPAFSLYSLAVQAAREGAGILMAHESLVSGLLASGELVAPFATRAKSGLSLALLCPQRPAAQAANLIDWLASPE